jgi:hypothetical protein
MHGRKCRREVVLKLSEPARQRSGASNEYIIMPGPAPQGQHTLRKRAQTAFRAISVYGTAEPTRRGKADPHRGG